MVPLKMLDGFDVVLSSLEKLAAEPEQIQRRPMSRNGVWPNGLGVCGWEVPAESGLTPCDEWVLSVLSDCDVKGCGL
jgi:hypothetical protein